MIMSMFLSQFTQLAVLAQPADESLKDLILRGGVLMIPIGVCSLIAMAFALERWIGLRSGALGSRRLERDIVEAARSSGRAAAVERCDASSGKAIARILRAGIVRADADFAEREKVVEDAAHAEIRRLGRNLRPLFLVWLIAPLLGLLGTVWGMIQAFKGIAGSEGLGNPKVLADGIYGALSTTAGGLAVAIPAIVAYWFLQGKIEAFAARVERSHRSVEEALREHEGGGAAPSRAPEARAAEVLAS